MFRKKKKEEATETVTETATADVVEEVVIEDVAADDVVVDDVIDTAAPEEIAPEEVVTEEVVTEEVVADAVTETAPVAADVVVETPAADVVTEPITETTPTTPTPTPQEPAHISSRPNIRKIREGIVVSNKMDKTAVVSTTDRVRHRRYAKTVVRTSKLFVHDANNDLGIGDRVQVAETRPMSKSKRWRLVKVLERAQ